MQQTKPQLLVDEDIDFGSGHIETRRCYVESQLSLYDDLRDWPSCKSVILVARDQRPHQPAESLLIDRGRRCGDLVLPPVAFNSAVRHHWGIENQLHWCLDRGRPRGGFP